MYRIHRSVLVAIAAAVLLLGAGCSAGPAAPPAPGTAAPAAPDTAAGVAWIDKVCGSMLEVNKSAQSPKIDTSSPQATFKGYSAFLGQLIDGIDRAVAGVKQAGASPLPGGDGVATKIVDTLSAYKTKLQEAKAGLDKADVNDPASIASTTAALQGLNAAPDAGKDLQTTPELEQAAASAPSCQAFKQVNGQPPAPDGTPGGY